MMGFFGISGEGKLYREADRSTIPWDSSNMLEGDMVIKCEILSKKSISFDGSMYKIF